MVEEPGKLKKKLFKSCDNNFFLCRLFIPLMKKCYIATLIQINLLTVYRIKLYCVD